MAAANPAGPPAYTIGPINADGVPFIDTTDGIPTLMPGFGASAPPTWAQVTINPITVADGAGMPPQNAILCELRVMTELLSRIAAALVFDGPKSIPDLDQLRADAAWDTNLSTGSL